MNSKNSPKLRRINFTVGDPIYRASLTCLFNYTWEEWQSYIAKHKHPKEPDIEGDGRDYSGMFAQIRNKEGLQCFVLWMPHFDWYISDQACLTHELVHYIHSLFEAKQIPVRYGNDETFAYAFEHYHKAILEKLKGRHTTYQKWRSRRKKHRKN